MLGLTALQTGRTAEIGYAQAAAVPGEPKIIGEKNALNQIFFPSLKNLRDSPDDCFHCERVAERRVPCYKRKRPETQRPSVDDKARPAHKCQPAAVATKPLYQSVNCQAASCSALEAVYVDGDDDDGDKLVWCLKR